MTEPAPAARSPLPEALLWAIGAAALYVATRSRVLDDWDSVQFALGVRAFDLFNHQPHPPGYPLYIGLARCLTRCTPLDITGSLVMIGCLSGGVFVGAWFWLLARQLGVPLARLAAATIMVMPMIWMTATKALSDMPAAAAMALTWALVWAWLERRRPRDLVAAGLMGALATGLRPQNILIHLIMPAVGLRREGGRRPWRTWLWSLATFVLVGLAWLIPTMASQARLPQAGGDVLAYPRQLLDQWRWRLDKPNVYLGAGDASPLYLLKRVYRHSIRSWLILGLGWDPGHSSGKAGCVLLLAGLWLYLRRRPWRDAAHGPFWRRQASWAPFYILMIFVCLPMHPRYYAPVAPLLVLPALAGLAQVRRVRWRPLAWAIPLLLVCRTAPLAWQGHVEAAPPVAMIRELQAMVPSEQRGSVMLLLFDARRHAEWYAPEFQIVWPWPTDPAGDPRIAQATALYTDDPDFLARSGWKGWRMIQVKVFERSDIIHLKHARCRLYRLEKSNSLVNMKHILILGDGMSDDPVARLGGRTPLQAARKPNIDRLAREGRCGQLVTMEADVPTGSEAANLAVMGYDPRKVLQGRGVLEAASMGVAVGDDDIAMRCNLICLEEGRIKNHSAGHITSEESAEIFETLQRELGSDDLRFHAGVSYRNLLVARGLDPRLECAPPHDHPNEPAEALMIQPRVPEARATADLLNSLTRRSWEILREHPVNQRRRAAGKDPGNSIWLWSPGRRPTMTTFHERFGVRGAVISAVDLIRGIGVYAGLEILKVEGATGLYDTNYEGKADACLEALERLDFCYVHVEAPDEAGHEGNLELKIRTIEDLDARLVGRILAGLEQRGIQAVIAVLPDHPTPVELRIHVRAPVPFLVRDPRRAPDAVQVYDEVSCAAGSYGLLHGDSFMRSFFGR